MLDREKVIKGLERCKLYNKVNCDKCPYDYNGRGDGKSECTAELASDAIALLKEQEAKQAIKHTYYVMIKRDYENPVEVTHYEWLCPTCKSLLCRDIDVIDDNYHFCKVCGQAVKWDD